MDDEDRYLDEILNKNYTGKAPPAVNWFNIRIYMF